MTAVIRRTLTALVLAFGLALMHGGIGQAMACSGMSQMASMTVPAATDLAHGHDASSAVNHAAHHELGDKPVAAHSDGMCMSTPATASGGDSKAGPSTVAAYVLPYATGQPQHKVTISAATGREPPAPDLISELCVIRR